MWADPIDYIFEDLVTIWWNYLRKSRGHALVRGVAPLQAGFKISTAHAIPIGLSLSHSCTSSR